MADLEVKQVNTLPKNSVVLSDYLLAIGTTEEYQAKMQDIIVAGLNNYKAKLITGYNTNVSVVEALNYVYNLQRDTTTANELDKVKTLLGNTKPDSSLGITSGTVSEAINEIFDKYNGHVRSYNTEINERIWPKIGSGDLRIGTTLIDAINQTYDTIDNYKINNDRAVSNVSTVANGAASGVGTLNDRVGTNVTPIGWTNLTTEMNAVTSTINDFNTLFGGVELATENKTIKGAINELNGKIGDFTTGDFESYKEEIQEMIDNIDVATDKNLLTDGKPADAKAAGDRIRTLEDFKREAEGKLDQVDTNTADINSIKTSDRNYANGVRIDSETGYLYLTHSGTDIGEGVHIEATGGGGLSFDTGYVAAGNADDGQDPESNYLHLTLNGDDIQGFTPFIVPSGGGGGSAVSATQLVFRKITAYKTSVLQNTESVPISFGITAKDVSTGDQIDGPVTIQVKNANSGLTLNTLVVQQGENTVDVARYLNLGSNRIQLLFSFEGDSGTVTLSKTFEVVVETFTLSWNINNDTMATSSDLTLNVYQSGSGAKTIYVTVDGKAYESREVLTTTSTESFNVKLNVGVHTVKVYGTMVTSGLVLNSDELSVVVARTSSTNRNILLAVT